MKTFAGGRHHLQVRRVKHHEAPPEPRRYCAAVDSPDGGGVGEYESSTSGRSDRCCRSARRSRQTSPLQPRPSQRATLVKRETRKHCVSLVCVRLGRGSSKDSTRYSYSYSVRLSPSDATPTDLQGFIQSSGKYMQYKTVSRQRPI